MLTTGDMDPIAGASPEGRPGWVRRHPVVSLVLIVLFILIADLSLLPYGELISYAKERPVTTAFQQAYLAEREASGKPARLRKEWVAYRSIPRQLVRAVLVSEDAAFWVHSGFDTYEIQQSVSDAMTEGRDLRGASTITQQLIKNLFLSSSRNPLRKLHEAILTVVAERALGKRRILELYLNEIEWGPGIYGVQAASRHYFSKDVEDLTAWESAFLASIIPSPTKYRPDEVTPYLKRRIDRTLRRMGVAVQPADSSSAPADSLETLEADSLSAMQDSLDQTAE